jgi:hypothetical protein
MARELYRGREIQELLTGSSATDAVNTLKALIDLESKNIWVDVACTAALLDASTGTGKVNVLTPSVATDQYKIREIRLVGGGTNFGGAGDRLLSLTDGTTVWTTIPNADLESAPAATLPWGNAKVPMLTGTSNTPSAAGAQIYFQYSGGTPGTPHSTGSITMSVMLERVA